MGQAVYKMNFYCGRMGSLEGVFVADKTAMESLIKSNVEIHFGEVLGKHSNISGPIDEEDITLVSEDLAVIKVIVDHELSSGYNPFDYMEDWEEYEDKDE